MESRVKEIDYLKCIFITLMIIFHLVYIGDKYPYAKQIVFPHVRFPDYFGLSGQ